MTRPKPPKPLMPWGRCAPGMDRRGYACPNGSPAEIALVLRDTRSFRQTHCLFWRDAGIGGNLGMRKALVFTIAVTLAANAQRIETEKSDPHKVVRVATAPNHLSVIELAEPVIEVAAGSSSYKIEWRDNKVFVQPLDPEATTNLFIWTASGRLSYELVPAQSVQDMQFAIDQEPIPHVGQGRRSRKTGGRSAGGPGGQARLGDAVRQHTGAPGRRNKESRPRRSHSEGRLPDE